MSKIRFNIHYIYFFSIAILSIFIFYPILVFDSINKYNPINFVFYMLSFMITIYAVISIKKNNLNSYNIFLLFYFFALFLNTFNLSTKQLEKELVDLYFYLLSPFIVWMMFSFVENLKIEKTTRFKNIFKFNVNSVYVLLLISYIFIKLYIGNTMGFRIYDYNDISIIVSGDKYVIPSISGISAILQWLLIIFIPYVKKRYSILAIISIFILSGVMNVKRGDIIRVLIFLLLYYTFIQIQLQKFTLKRVLTLSFGIAIFLFIFIMYGEYRLEARGGTEGMIVEYLGSRIDSVAISWIYSYFSINFEILKFYYNFTPSYDMLHMYELFGANLNTESIGLNTSISGFNASTFISPYILDFGYFHFIEVFVFTIIVGTIIYTVRKIDFLGLYLFLLMLISLMIFGDYIINRAIFMSIIIAIIIFPFLKVDKNISIKGLNK